MSDNPTYFRPEPTYPDSAVAVETDFGIYVHLTWQSTEMNHGVHSVMLTGRGVAGTSWQECHEVVGIAVAGPNGYTAYPGNDPADIDYGIVFNGPDALTVAEQFIARIGACAPYGFR